MENTIVGPNENAKDSGLRLISTMGVNTDGHVPVDSQIVNSSGGIISEFILKRGTTYQRSILSGAASNIVQFEASWTEIEDKT